VEALASCFEAGDFLRDWTRHPRSLELLAQLESRLASTQSHLDRLRAASHMRNKKIKAADRFEHEDTLLVQAAGLLKAKCADIAKQKVCQATVSFEVLSREIEGFPQQVVNHSTYHVESFGHTSLEECWTYAARGLDASRLPGTHIQYAEVLVSMFPSFVAKVQAMGYKSVEHNAGTWKLTATWLTGSDFNMLLSDPCV
ncbi:unnamed protein product, partial [Prorocentrum cordatum]